MTLGVLRGRRSRGSPEPAPAALAIEIGAETPVATCPQCGRPNAIGTARCPGCATLLLLNVPIRRAGLFLIVGAVFGMLAGGSLMAAATAASRSQAQAQPSAAAGQPAVGRPAITAAPPSAQAAPGAPAAGLDALRQAVVIDGRLTARATALKAVAAAQPLDAFAVATALRAIAADAAIGSDATVGLDGWDAGVPLQAQLQGLYGSIRATARAALDAPFADGAAYRAAAHQMEQILAQVPTADGAVRSLAARAGADLPVATAP